jgi:hypothetical protein
MGNAELARMRRRKQAAIVREDFALAMFARGIKVKEISAAMVVEYGLAGDDGTTRAIIRRGLARRAANAPEGTDDAREILMEGYRQILAAHMPLAVGDIGDGPSTRSAEVAMRALDRMAEITGVRRVPDTNVGGVNLTVNVGEPGSVDKARNQILAGLRAEAAKHEIVEGHLASVGTSQAALTSGEPDDDTLGPPPGVIPTQEEEAA